MIHLYILYLHLLIDKSTDRSAACFISRTKRAYNNLKAQWEKIYAEESQRM